MDTIDKLSLLSDASQYDLACACGSSAQDHRTRAADGAWLYPVSLPRGGNSIMLKTLMSNVCVNDCKYCPYRGTVDVPRCTIGPDEIASVFMDYVNQNKVFGIFLSSGVIGTADNTMTILNDAAKILRVKYNYRGYVHLKVIPGASDAAIEEALSLANAVSINIETPGKHHFARLSSKKDFLADIIRPMKKISELTAKDTKYSKVKKTTQFIVGASNETDEEIVKYTAGLYDRLNLNRVYFSAYQRGLGQEDIPGERNVSGRVEDTFVREHRLYQVDFLFRKYKFTQNDISFDNQGQLSLQTDPKRLWADCHPDFFPVNINRASFYTLLRVPGIGPITAKNIIAIRKEGAIRNIDNLGFSARRCEMLKNYVIVN